MPFVVDASIAMAWLFKDETTAYTAKLLEKLEAETAVVPGLWHLEIINVASIAERKGRVTSAQIKAFIDDVMMLPLEVDYQLPSVAFTHLLPLCRTHKLTSYDAVYLELAMRRRLPLATLDMPLRKAAKEAGVKLLA